MGILEQILEANKDLSVQVASLSSELSSMKAKIEDIQTKDKLILEFSDDETLNTSVTARVLGIKKTELDKIIETGLLHSVGERKRIFLAKDVLNYMKFKDEPNKPFNIIPKKKKKKTAARRDVLSKDKIAELISLNSV